MLAVSLAALSFAPRSAEFESYKLAFGKTYASSEHEDRAFAAYVTNMEWVKVHNEMARADNASVVYGETKFSDMTPAEFSASHGYTPRKDRVEGEAPAFNGFCPACDKPGLEEVRGNVFGRPGATKNALGVFVDEFDWGDKGAVTPVKDQAQCGSCWAFGTTGDIEGVDFIATGKLPSLSEQQLVSCDTSEDEGCNGGLQEDAFDYVIKQGGLVSESDYPYTSGTGKTGRCKLSPTAAPAGKITSWSQVSSSAKGETNVGPTLQAQGPVTIGIDASQMQNYKSGVDYPKSCSARDVDHAVLITGFGKTDTYPNYPYYWKIKNSWGTDWGEDGYYRIMAGVSACGLATDVVHSAY
jgi:cathepsin F